MNVGILEGWLKLRDDLTPALKGVAGTLDGLSSKLSKAAGDILPISAALTIAGGASVKFASDFGAAMNESLAILPEFSEAVRKDLGDTAREVALTTTQSATDAAKAYYFLASAGITTAEALKTALPIAAQFAQAGVMDMANATEILVDSVKSLGLSVDTDMGHVGDVIVKAAVASSASVQQLGDALTNKAATAMRTFGVSIEEGAAVLSVFADQGVKGSIAGERLSILLNGLAEAAGKHEKEFKALNVQLYDGSGNFKNLQQIAASVEVALRGMSTEQKIATLETLGLTRETKSAVLQLVGASSEIGRYETAYKNAGGTMKEIADNQMKSFSAQTDILKKKVIDAAISFGDALIPTLQRMIPIVENAIKFLNDLIKAFAGLSDSTKDLLIGFAALLMALPGILFGLGAIAGASGVMASGLATLTTAVGATGAAVLSLTLVGAGFVAGGAMILYFLAQYVSIQQDAAAATRATALEMDRHKKIIEDNTATNQEAAKILHSLILIQEHGGTVTSSLRVAVQNLSATTVESLAVKKMLADMDAKDAANKTTLINTSKILSDEQKKLAEIEAKSVEAFQKFKELEVWQDIEATAQATRDAEKATQEYAKSAKALADIQEKALGDLSPLAQKASDITKKAVEKAIEASKASIDWSKTLGIVSDAFEIMGISADSTLGKTITALTATIGITKEMSKAMVDAGGNATKSFDKLSDTHKAEVAMAGLNTALIAYKSGALGGAAAGATFGASFGPIGAAIGGVVGGLLGWIGGSSKAKAEAAKLTAEIEKQRQAFIKNAGGLEILQSKAREAGLTLDAVFNAKTLEAYNKAVDDLNAKFEDLTQANQDLEAAMEKYGITVEQLGPKFAQQQLDKQAAQLLKEYMLLNAAGVDHTVIISKMGPELQKYVNQSLAAGTAIPENMRPILEEMLRLGLLTDEAGNKLENLDGLKFTESLTEGLSRAIDAINRLVAALLGIPDVTRTVTINQATGGGSSSGDTGGSGEVAAAKGFSGYVSSPTRFLVGENGPEHVEVTPLGKSLSGQNPSGSGDIYLLIDWNQKEVRQTTASDVQKFISSGKVRIPARMLTRRAS